MLVKNRQQVIINQRLSVANSNWVEDGLKVVWNGFV